MESTARRTALDLGLVVAAGDGARHDVRAEFAPEAPAHELLAALAEEAGLDGDLPAARRGGHELPADAPLAELDLRHGDEISFGDERAAPSLPAVAELVVVGGPQAGRRVPLLPGVHRVGREASIAIDDPSLSAQHLVLTIDADGAASVADAGSRNGTLVEGVTVPAGEERQLQGGDLVQAGRTLLSVAAPEIAPPDAPVDGAGRVPFNRPPRVQRLLEPSTRPFPAPPGDPQRSRLPLGASLIPLLLGIGLYAVTKLPTMLFFSLLSPVMALSTYIEDRRSGRKGFERHSREYRRRLAALRDELAVERREEVARRRARAPSPPELLRRAHRLEPALWERRPDDPDFLELRVGTADLPSLLTVRLDPGGSEALRAEVEELAAWYATVPSVPVTVPLAELGVVGLCGPRERVEALARLLVAQAAVLHAPGDLAVAAAVAPGRRADWEWLKWLPHAEPESGGPAIRLAAEPEATRGLLEEISRLVAARRADSEGSYGAASRRSRPHVLLLLDEEVAPERALVRDVLVHGREHAVSVLWIGRERRDLPGEAAGILELEHDSARLTVTDARAGVETRDISADGIDADLARDLALALAPVREAGAARSEGIPERVALLDLLGEDDVDSAWVAERWAGDAEGLGAPVGVTASGPFSVDLRADGPHGLVAGTTGSGKSELLQTLIASLAVAHPPDRLAFLLVDYKGGAAFKDCVRLPHTVGLVTDLDAHLTQRALASLNAELQRRERILRDAGAKDLADMERRSGDGAPPSLLIVIDEFATLAKEVPDFVEGIVDVAQRGRSLGVHLLLATQRPGGVVSENIRANTNLRVALRVNEAAESSDVIGVPDAARIPRGRPGRAYARTGHGELAELQTAYVGGGRPTASEAAVVVRPFPFGGSRAQAQGAADGADTDLARLVDACAAAAEARCDRAPAVAVAAAARGGPGPRHARRAGVGVDGRRRPPRRASAPAAEPARARPRAGGQRPRLRDERRGQDRLPAHARPRARRTVVAGRAPRLRARLRDPGADAARVAAAHRSRDRRRGRGANRAAVLASSENSRAPQAALRAGGRLHAHRLPPPARCRAAAAHPRRARRLRGLRGRLRARQPRRARRRAASARRGGPPARRPLRDLGRSAWRRPERAGGHHPRQGRAADGRRRRVRSPRRPAQVRSRSTAAARTRIPPRRHRAPGRLARRPRRVEAPRSRTATAGPPFRRSSPCRRTSRAAPCRHR